MVPTLGKNDDTAPMPIEENQFSASDIFMFNMALDAISFILIKHSSSARLNKCSITFFMKLVFKFFHIIFFSKYDIQ